MIFQTEVFSMYRLEFKLEGLPKTTNSLAGAKWQVRAAHAKKWKRAVWRTVWPLKPESPLVKAKITLTRFSSREADFDGLVSSFKHIIDGLTEAGIIIDDKRSVIDVPVYIWEKTSPKNGHIKVLVEELQKTGI